MKARNAVINPTFVRAGFGGGLVMVQYTKEARRNARKVSTVSLVFVL